MTFLQPFIRWGLTLFAVGGGALTAVSGAGELVKWKYSGHEDRVVDVMLYGEGAVCVLFASAGPKIFTDPTQPPQALPSPKGVGEKLRVFPGRTHDALLLVCRTGQEAVGVYEWQGSAWETKGTLPLAISSARLHRDAAGGLWGWSMAGADRLAEGAVDHCDFEGLTDNLFSSRPPELVDWGTDGVGFVPRFGTWDDERGLDHLVSFRKGVWSKTKCEVPQPGAAAAGVGGKVLIGSEAGVSEIELGTGTVRRLAPPPPVGQGQRQQALFLKQLADGTLLSVWARRTHYWPTFWIAPRLYENHYATVVAEFRDGQWSEVQQGADPIGWQLGWYERPWCADGQGGIWLGTMGGGLLHRAANGVWRRLDWRSGMAFRYPSRLVVDGKQTLWVVDAKGGCMAIDQAAALRQPAPPASRWEEVYLRAAPLRCADGTPCGITGDGEGSLTFFRRDRREQVAFDPRLADVEGGLGFERDTQNRFWVYNGHHPLRTGCYDGRQWQVFRSEQEQEARERETAFRKALGYNPAHSVGKYLQDGVNDTMGGGLEIVRSLGASTSGMDVSFVPPRCPIPRKKWRWIMEDALAVWVSDGETMATCLAGNWMTTSLQMSPLAGGLRPAGVFADENGRWWFLVSGGYRWDFFVYQGPTIQLQTDNLDLGAVPRPFAKVVLPLHSAGQVENLLFRWRVDDRPWGAFQADTTIDTDILEPGDHRVTVEAYGQRELAHSNQLTYQFTVAYNVDDEIGKLVAALGDSSFTTRQQATTELPRYGPRAKAALETAANHADPEIAERARQILAGAGEPKNQERSPR